MLARSTGTAGITPVAYGIVPFSAVSTGWFFPAVAGVVPKPGAPVALRTCGELLESGDLDPRTGRSYTVSKAVLRLFNGSNRKDHRAGKFSVKALRKPSRLSNSLNRV